MGGADSDPAKYIVTPEDLAAPPPQPAGHQVDLDGWDTANVLRMETLNAAIKKNTSATPGTFDASNALMGAQAKGTWGPWEIAPDPKVAGAAVRVICPVQTGTWFYPGYTKAPQKLDGAKIYVTVNLSVINDKKTKITDKTGKPTSKSVVQSIVVTDPSKVPNNGVVVTAITPAKLMSGFQMLFQEWFNTYITDFTAIFHTAVLNEKADVGAFQWLKPTGLSFASLTNAGGDGVFAALCQTEHDPDDKNAQQISAAILDDMPKGANAVFAISDVKFAQKFLKLGAHKMLPNSKITDFEITGDGNIVRNNASIVWSNFTLADGNTIAPVIPARGMTMRVIEDQIQIEFTNITFKHKLVFGNDIITLSFQQKVKLKVVRNAKGEPVVVTDHHDLLPSGTKRRPGVPAIEKPLITVTPDQTAVTAGEVLKYVSIGAAFLGAASFVGGVFSMAAPAMAAASADIGAAISAGNSIFDVAVDAAEMGEGMSDAEVAAANAEAFDSVLNASTAPVKAASMGMFGRAGLALGVIGATSGILTGIRGVRLANDLGIDPDTVPSLDTFLDSMIGASQWPNLSTWDLVDAKLAKSLLLYGNIQT